LGENIPRLILNQFRWLEYVVKPLDLTKKLIEMIGITPLNIQREIILSIPEIVSDNQHRVPFYFFFFFPTKTFKLKKNLNSLLLIL